MFSRSGWISDRVISLGVISKFWVFPLSVVPRTSMPVISEKRSWASKSASRVSSDNLLPRIMSSLVSSAIESRPSSKIELIPFLLA